RRLPVLHFRRPGARGLRRAVLRGRMGCSDAGHPRPSWITKPPPWDRAQPQPLRPDRARPRLRGSRGGEVRTRSARHSESGQARTSVSVRRGSVAVRLRVDNASTGRGALVYILLVVPTGIIVAVAPRAGGV